MNKPIISLIVAMANNRVIGKNNQMPWHLPADLQHFKTITLGKPIIMGRKTYESIGRPLPGRKNIVISHNSNYKLDGCETVTSLEKALKLVNNFEEVMIIGGGFLYAQTLHHANKLYLTFIDLDIDGDTIFPDFEKLNIKEVKRDKYLKDEKNIYNYEFVEYIVK